MPLATKTRRTIRVVEPVRAIRGASLINAALACLWLACAPQSAPSLDGVILVVLDTFRADRLSIDGYLRETTPVLDALAGRGVLFEQAITSAPWTLPAMISLMTGRPPSKAVYSEDLLLSSTVETLRDAGLHTVGFTEGGFFSSHFGFARGFVEHHEIDSKVHLVLAGRTRPDRGGIEETFAAAERWLRDDPALPFFLLIHSYEPHVPYRRSLYTAERSSGQLGRTFEDEDSRRIHLEEIELGEEELTYLAALYDGGIAVSDRHIGQLLAALEEVGLADRVAVVVTSDHGEDLGGRSPRRAGDHGHTLYDELLRVPLILYNPLETYSVERVTTQVRLVDLLPTVLDLFGLPPAGAVSALSPADGRSLLPLLRGQEVGDRAAFSRVMRKGTHRVSVRLDGFKLIDQIDAEGARPSELYDLESDAGERSNLIAREGDRVAELAPMLAAFLEQQAALGVVDFRKVKTDELPARLRDHLRALGYVD